MMGIDSWLGLRHVALRVADVVRSRAFYTELLGFRVEWEPDARSVYLTSGQDNLALHHAATPCARGEVSPLDHFGFVVTRRDAVDAWHDRVLEYGARVVHPPRDHRDGARSFYFSDPDDNTIQILYHPPLAQLPAGPDPRGTGGDKR